MAEKIKVLIVEDEVMMAMGLETGLSLLGYDVCEFATSGEEAIKLTEREKPDVVIMDIRLAGSMDGIQAAKAIISRRDVPIIFMSGYSLEEVRERVEEIGPVACLEKPVRLGQIESATELALTKV